jgi:hypothetical protein
MLAAFWSGFYVGFLKREGEKPPMPFADDIDDIVDRVKDSITKEKEAEPSGFYD